MPTPTAPRILLALHRAGVGDPLPAGLQAAGFAVEVTRNMAETWVSLQRQPPAAVVLAPARQSAVNGPELSSLVARTTGAAGIALLLLTDQPEALRPRWPAIDDFLPTETSAEALGRRVLFAVDRRRAQLREKTEHALLARQATTDFKTGLLNDRAFVERCRVEASRARRQGLSVAVLVIDFDRFKSLNDTHGHEAGDRALAAFGQLLRNSLRDFDSAARVGGDEFAVLLPGTRLPTATSIAERVRAALADLALEQNGARLKLSISVGVSDWDPERGLSLEAVVREADAALLAAKGAGGNRVMARSASAAQGLGKGAPPAGDAVSA
ncbi:MAG: GGDEF domain-containing protein [Planctomycetota bacterium]